MKSRPQKARQAEPCSHNARDESKVTACRTPTRDLPEGWEWKTLGETCHVILGQSPESATYNRARNGLPFFQGKSEFGDRYPTVLKWCSHPKKVAKKNDILVSVRAPVGPTNIAPSECCIGRGLAALCPSDGVNHLYLFHYLKNIENKLSEMGTGTTFKAISGDVLRSIEIPIAPLDQQKLIVSEVEKQFSRLDEAVAGLKRVKANLKRYKASVLKAAVEGKLTEEWRKAHANIESGAELLKRILVERKKKWEEKNPGKKYKEPVAPDTSNLPDLPTGWVWATIEQLSCKVQYGSSAKTSEDRDGVPVLRMGNIFEGQLKSDDLKYLPRDHSEFPELFLKEGDLLFNRTNSPELVGKTTVYTGKPSPCSFASYLIRVQFTDGTSPPFVSFFINSVYGRKWIKTVVSQQVGQANVNGTKLQALTVPLPPYSEQKKIIEEVESCLSVAEQIEAAIDVNLKRAERLRQGILKKAFSGRLVP
jgi:type I restriction enzyme, S subunit